MLHGNPTRRIFLKSSAIASSSALLGTCPLGIAQSRSGAALHVACNQVVWEQFYTREKRSFDSHTLDTSFGEVTQSGMDGFEPVITTIEQIDEYGEHLKRHGLEMRSLYVDSSMHESDLAEKSIREILAVAEKARAMGTRIIVTNPNPLRADEGDAKSDHQLQTQAAALERLGAKLKAIDVTLAYHSHAAELRRAAREFHHMMLGTDPANVTLCLDAHWMYRGANNSAIALFDIVKLYGHRISELHLRQSINNVWTESMSDGDIDYPALA